MIISRENKEYCTHFKEDAKAVSFPRREELNSAGWNGQPPVCRHATPNKSFSGTKKEFNVAKGHRPLPLPGLQL